MHRLAIGILVATLSATACEDEAPPPPGDSASQKKSAEQILEEVDAPAVTLESIFEGQQRALTTLKSREQERDGAWARVPGKYTAPTWKALHEASAIDAEYEQQYVKAWRTFLEDIEVSKPADHDAMLEQLRAHTEKPVLLASVIRTVAENSTLMPGIADDSPIAEAFAPLVALTQSAKNRKSPLVQWAELAKKARATIVEARDNQQIVRLEESIGRVRELLEPLDPATRELVGPWLLHPLGAEPEE